ncbi:MAG: DUF308 domain-containing protein [Lachnospiraceae bacterium]|nr:DUF308 domain-containing protein [Lachnospiraceae bacterium]MDD7078556.1 DUF308 domain-containing protein [Lachnospiraceae bacterium]MDY3731339.1 DUF308 domain-containing protein [Candidatus Choladocola sp.]
MNEVKQFSKSYILVSALYVVLGVVLLVWPGTSVKMICYGLGFAMVVLGITYGIIYFTKDNLQGFLQMDLVIGIVCLAFGVFILLNPTFLATVLPFAMGIILLLGAVVKIQSSWNMRRLKFKKWYLVLICALVIIALGIVLLCNPFQEEKFMIFYIGACLILDGLTNLISLICIQVKVKKLAKIQREHPEVQLKDLLEQEEKKSTGDSDMVPAEVSKTDNRQE